MGPVRRSYVILHTSPPVSYFFNLVVQPASIEPSSSSQVSNQPFHSQTQWLHAVDKTEGWDAIQRHLDRLERWAQVDLRKFSMAKCKVSH